MPQDLLPDFHVVRSVFMAVSVRLCKIHILVVCHMCVYIVKVLIILFSYRVSEFRQKFAVLTGHDDRIGLAIGVEAIWDEVGIP